MENCIPAFPAFDPELDCADMAGRWRKWLARLENLFVALNITGDARKRALLLHYAGERVHDIFDAEKPAVATAISSSTSTTQGATPDPATYDGTVNILTAYFSPKRNLQMERYIFRSCVQTQGQPLEAYVTELRRLAQSCSFHDNEQEVLSQLIQHCSSQRLRRRALREPDKSLSDIITMGRLLEQSEAQARQMETGNSSVNAVQRSQRNQRQHIPEQKPRKQQWQSNQQARKQYQSSSSKVCRNCGGDYPHQDECPAKGRLCNFCKKPNHFERCCRSKAKAQHVRLLESQATPQAAATPHHSAPIDPESDASDDYCFVVRAESISATTPKATVMLADKPVSFLVDTGTSVDVIDEATFGYLGKPAFSDKHSPTLFAYGATTPLPVIGVCDIRTSSKTTSDNFIISFSVVAGNSGCLLSYETSKRLNLVRILNGTTSIKDQYPQLSKGIGKLAGQQFKLHIDESVPPAAITNRRTPFHLRAKVEDELARLLSQDIIEKVVGEATPWVSPIVTPPKKDGSIRLCVDMREPNKAIRRERHTIPTVDELINDLNGAVRFSKIDLRAGYHQLELSPESRYITTFSTHKGLYRYKRLSFGISSASEIFQEAIRTVIRDIPGARNISDDIICFGSSTEDHDRAVKQTLSKLQESGLTVNWDKCEFGVQQIGFFGLVFSAEGVSPDPKKVEAVRAAEPPTNASQVRSFLGMMTYSARFINGFATVSEPLRRLTVKDAEWTWGPEQQTAFQELKARMTDSATIAYYDPNASIEVFTDASPVGLGAVLVQDNKVVAYASRALTPVESRYSQTEREALGIVWACEHFDIYLRGAPSFAVITDHKPLVTIWSKPRPPLRIERWGLRLQPYKLTIIYKPGRDNPADYMSRHPLTHRNVSISQSVAEQYVNFIATTSAPKAMTLAEIAEETAKDRTLMHAISLTQSGRWHEATMNDDPDIDTRELQEYRNAKADLTFHSDGVLLRGSQIIIPASLRKRVIALAHEGHQGMSRTKAFVRSKVWFPGINADVESAIQRCVICQAVQLTPTPLEPLRMSAMPPGPWQHVSMDFCGPLPSGDYLLVLVDEFSRYPVVEILKSVSAAAVLPVLDKVFSVFGFPKILKSDNGSPFNSAQFARYASHSGFTHRRITPCWPRANAQAESFNKPLMKSIRSAHLERKSWKQEMFKFLRQYRSTPHTSTGISPYRLLFGRDPITRLPQISDVADHDRDDRPTAADPTTELAKANDAIAKRKQKAYADNRNKARFRDLAIGDCVMIRDNSRGNKLSPPFQPIPMLVVAMKGNMITAEGGNRRVTRNVSFFKKVSINQSSRDVGSDSDLEDDADDDCPLTPATPTPHPHTPPPSRSRRRRRPPSYLKDYVTNARR